MSPFQLSAEQIKKFHVQGYLFPVDVLTQREVREVLAAYQRYRTVVDRAGGLLNKRWNHPKVHLIAKWADALVHHPRLLDLATDVIGPDLLVWSTTVFVRERRSSSRLAWHQDAPYYGWAGSEDAAVRIWVALTRTTRQNGTLLYCRESHTAGLLPHDFIDRSPAGVMQGEQVEYTAKDEDIVAVEIDAGQASLHQPTTVHSSGPSSVDAERICFAVDYLAPSIVPLYGQDSALLVRGDDRYEHFVPEKRPESDFAPAAIRQFRDAVVMRERRLATVMRTEHARKATRSVG